MRCEICYRERTRWAWFCDKVVCEPCIYNDKEESRGQMLACCLGIIAPFIAGFAVVLLWPQ